MKKLNISFLQGKIVFYQLFFNHIRETAKKTISALKSWVELEEAIKNILTNYDNQVGIFIWNNLICRVKNINVINPP